ncbi:MAG: peptidylprolyl isomerase [Candidatus Omnitrophica bacterium]|nr:peptidylprolyl isomerase [Candidatus Omnitrophota bacterium]
MRSRRTLLKILPAVLTVAALVFSPCGAVQASSEMVDRILVIINDEIVTESDLNQFLYPLYTRLKATLSGPELQAKMEEARERMLQQMVEDRLIVSAAREAELEVKEEEIDEMVDDMRKKFPNQEVFETVLREQGLSFKKLREQFHDRILKRQMIDFKVRSRVSVSPADVSEYYAAHVDEFEGQAEVRVRQILVRTGQVRSEDTARTIAISIVEKLDQGQSMEELARIYSEGSEADRGGEMGWVKKGQFMERIDRELFRLNEGTHSDPIKTQLGYHIFKIEETRNPEPQSLEEVKDRIRNFLYQEKTEELLRKYLAELRQNAYIAFKD